MTSYAWPAALATFAAAVMVAALDLVRRMTASTWHPYRFSVVALCTGAFGQGAIRVWPVGDCPAVAGDITLGLILAGMAGLFAFDRRRRGD